MFLQIIDIKYTKQNFCSDVWGGVGLGAAEGQNFIFSKHGNVAYQIDRDDKYYRVQVKSSPYGACNSTFFRPHQLGPWGGFKRSNMIKFQLPNQFQRFLYQTLCVFLQII